MENCTAPNYFKNWGASLEMISFLMEDLNCQINLPTSASIKGILFAWSNGLVWFGLSTGIRGGDVGSFSILVAHLTWWRREWQPTPVPFPGESPGQGSLASYSPWGLKESDTREQLTHLMSAAFWLALLADRDALIVLLD